VSVLRQRMNGKQVDAEALKNDEQLKKVLAEVTPQLLVNAVDELLLLQRGRELGLHLGDDQFKQVVNNIRKEQGLTDEDKFQKALAQESMTIDDLRKQLERQMLIEQVQRQEVGSKLSITEEEARQYYARHPEEFMDPASVTLREILIAVPTDARGLNVAADEAAKARADQVRARVLAGESFEQLVAEVSDAPSKASGGLVTGIRISDLTGELRLIVEALKVGGITDVLRTQRGYQILKLEASTPNDTMGFDQARERISERVFTGKRRDEFEKYLTKLRTQAIIEWKNADIQKAFEEGLKLPPPANQ